MIQDILPSRFANHYVHLQPKAENKVLFFKDGNLSVRYDKDRKEICFPLWNEFTDAEQAVYLFSIDDEPYFLVMEAGSIPEGYELYSLRDLRALEQHSRTGIFIAFTAWHLWNWYRNSRYCGSCGTKTEFDTVERAVVCPKCGNKIYPRINPAVIVGVTNGNRLLLTKYKVGYGHNAMIAGFTEIGETVEETVQREVMEEVGLKVRNIRYYKSQPWGIAADILMGFYCDVDGDDTIHRDDSELKYAEWVEREAIELQPDDLSLTNEMMKMFKENRL